MIDKKIEEILDMIEDAEMVAQMHHWGYGGSQPTSKAERYKKIKSLLKEYAMEIIGEDELPPPNYHASAEESNAFNAWIDLGHKGYSTRNQLRAEQREKVQSLI